MSKTSSEAFSEVANHGEKSKTVLVVYGRNLKARDALFEFLRSIDLKPLDLIEAIHKTGKGTPYIGDTLETAFSLAQAVVVLMTPDDEAHLREPYTKADDPLYETELTPQARPNVLFEAGMAMGKFPDHTILIELGNLRPFSDISGRHVVKLDDSIEKRQDLAERLKSIGCPISLEGTKWHEAGNFMEALKEPKGETKKPEGHHVEAVIVPSKEIQRIALLLDRIDITKLAITNNRLDQIYERLNVRQPLYTMTLNSQTLIF